MCQNYSLRRFCEEWRIWIRPFLIITYVIFAIIVVPLLIVYSLKDGFSRRDQLILIGGLFVLSAVPVSIFHIIQHVIHFTKPVLQKHIIRILWMVPIYALNAWLGLLFPKHSIYVDSLRECYEAYVIYNFMVYLLHYLNLTMDLEATMEYKPQVHHFFPLCCLRPWIMGREFIHNCKHGILQYTVVRPITTFISVVCEICGVYGEGTFAGNVAFPYIVAINNLSQFVAMYCLVLFYKANKDDLKPMKPIPKFLCIKAVVFFSFFQGVILNILVFYDFIKIFGAERQKDEFNVASMLQNFLICIEMFLAAVAHIYSFPHHPFHINSPQYWNNPNHNWCRAFLSMMDISDIQEDVSEHLGVMSSSISRRFQGRTSYQPLPRGPRRSSSESEYLINKRQDGEVVRANLLVVPADDLPDTGAQPSTSKTSIPINNHFSSATSTNFAGISIQKREPNNHEFSTHYGAPVTGGPSFLQARNVSANPIPSPIPESSDDYASFSASESISIGFSSSLKLSNSDSNSKNSSDWLSSPDGVSGKILTEIGPPGRSFTEHFT
uniref:Organic solute transporter ostalpha n=1 Tax=Glossina morsitans morsitans TaxID=37546 RepID=A0A1B0G0H4_GLOMM